MARSHTTTVKVPHSIADALEAHFSKGALGEYPSRNAMNVGLMLYAAIFPKIHRLTALQAGHGREILFRHYRELVTKAEAEEYFSITV